MRGSLVRLAALAAWTCAGFAAAGSGAAEDRIYVSPTGSDAHDGSSEAPVATLHGAQRRLRALKQQDSSSPIEIVLAAGDYYLERPVAFTVEDSGTVDAPLTIAAAPGATVRIIGGRAIDAWQLVSDESILQRLTNDACQHVLVVDLKALGIEDYGDVVCRGHEHAKHPAGLEVFYRGGPAQLARWPNAGWATVKQSTARGSESLISLSPAPTRSWRSLAGAWAHGFWDSDWSDALLPLAGEASNHNVFTIQRPSEVAAIRTGARCCVFNLLEELDQPGEWHLDRDSGRLYFWPPAPLSAGDVVVSLLEHPLSFYDVSHCTLRGVTIEAARACAVEIVRGEAVTIENCTLRNAGNLGAHVFGGRGHRIVNCEIYHTGEGGLRIEGGDRKTLQGCGHVVENNDLHDYARTCFAWHAAISLHGVGIRVANNLIHNGPDGAIHINGNDHVIERNEIHSVCLETADAGAIYLGHDWTERGNVIRHNYLHRLGRFNRRDVMGVYLDDFASGALVEGNLFLDAGRSVVIGGGRDNRIENNLIIDGFAGVQIDSRGLTWAKAHVLGENAPLRRRYAAVVDESSHYLQRYPALAHLLEDEPALAKGNVITRNLFCCRIGLDIQDNRLKQLVAHRHNWHGADPQFVDRAARDFRLRADSPAWKLGFQPIPIAKIGRQSGSLQVSNSDLAGPLRASEP